MAHGESNVIKSTAMNVLPFSMTEAARNGLQDFKSGAVNWVDLTIESETIDCLCTRALEPGQKLQDLVSGEDARFASDVFVLFCSFSLLITFLQIFPVPIAWFAGLEHLCILLPRKYSCEEKNDNVIEQSICSCCHIRA